MSASKPGSSEPSSSSSSSDTQSLAPRVYEELRRVASHYLRRERHDHTLQPTALVHEAWLRLAHQKDSDWESESHFVGIAARVMRQVLVDHDRIHRAAKRGKGAIKLSLDHDIVGDEDRTIDIVDLDEAIRRLAEQDPQHAQIVELRFFGGLSVEETAQLLKVSDSTVKRNWRMARAWLYSQFDTDERSRPQA